MSNVIHDFKKSLARGERAEAILLTYFPHLIKQDKCSFDFLDPSTGLKLELKSDFYGLNKSPNFFIERYSNLSTKAPGGPWQAQKHEADYYLYFYPNDLTLFIMPVAALLSHFDTKTYGSISVRNKAWLTTGYKVPRSDLSHLFIEIQLKDGVVLKYENN